MTTIHLLSSSQGRKERKRKEASSTDDVYNRLSCLERKGRQMTASDANKIIFANICKKEIKHNSLF